MGLNFSNSERSVASLSGRLIAFLVGCIVTCENAPCTVRIPATAKTTTRKLMRRFMICLHSNDLPDMPRECNTQIRPRQAVRRNLACPGEQPFPSHVGTHSN